MVAAERMGRVQAEERLQNAEDNLVAAEAAVRDMQLHLQSLPTTAVPSNESPHSSAPPPSSRRYLSSHVPYAEYITFLHHLRALRPLKGKSKDIFPAPIITILLAQPFLARAVTEDHDSTLRLDAAPDLSWLTRKGVSQAIIAGDLIIEPVSASTIITHSSSSIDSIGCSLCGKPVFPPTLPQSPGGSPFGPPPSHPAQRTTSSSRFSLKPFFKASPSQAISSPTQSPLASPGPGQSSSHSALSSVYIFRIAATQASDKEPRAYPLCKTGWCLERLRATCDLWHFVRTGIIYVVWSADDGYVLASESTQVTPRGNGELERPQEVVRLKLEWGLGFKLAEKTGSGGGGWGKGWTRSNPGSPGVERGKELGEVEEVGEKKEGLGAPLELEASAAEGQIGERNTSEGQNAEEVKEVSKEESKSTVDGEDKVDGEVPTIHETNPSPSVPMSETVRSELPTENASAEETSLQAPKLHRADSTPSVNGTDDGASFSTPNNTALELPDENGGFNIATDVVDLSSPSTESRSIPPSPGKDGKMPPPIPKRAAGRKRPKQLEVGGSSRSSLERVEGESEGRFTPIEGISGDEETKIELVGERANGTEGPSETETEGSRRPSLPPRPTLPPRHPKTPISHVPELASEGQKTFSGGDGWEVRTWKQVIRLKEEMWRARVGVLDN